MNTAIDLEIVNSGGGVLELCAVVDLQIVESRMQHGALVNEDVSIHRDGAINGYKTSVGEGATAHGSRDPMERRRAWKVECRSDRVNGRSIVHGNGAGAGTRVATLPIRGLPSSEIHQTRRGRLKRATGVSLTERAQCQLAGGRLPHARGDADGTVDIGNHGAAGLANQAGIGQRRRATCGKDNRSIGLEIVNAGDAILKLRTVVELKAKARRVIDRAIVDDATTIKNHRAAVELHRAGVGERTTSDSAAIPLEQPGREIERRARGIHSNESVIEVDNSRATTGVGAFPIRRGAAVDVHKRAGRGLKGAARVRAAITLNAQGARLCFPGAALIADDALNLRYARADTFLEQAFVDNRLLTAETKGDVAIGLKVVNAGRFIGDGRAVPGLQDVGGLVGHRAGIAEGGTIKRRRSRAGQRNEAGAGVGELSCAGDGAAIPLVQASRKIEGRTGGVDANRAIGLVHDAGTAAGVRAFPVRRRIAGHIQESPRGCFERAAGMRAVITLHVQRAGGELRIPGTTLVVDDANDDGVGRTARLANDPGIINRVFATEGINNVGIRLNVDDAAGTIGNDRAVSAIQVGGCCDVNGASIHPCHGGQTHRIGIDAGRAGVVPRPQPADGAVAPRACAGGGQGSYKVERGRPIRGELNAGHVLRDIDIDLHVVGVELGHISRLRLSAPDPIVVIAPGVRIARAITLPKNHGRCFP